MKSRNRTLLLFIEHVVPLLVLMILLTYSYAKFFRHSYGFRFDASTGLVVFVFEHQPDPTLRVNDRILRVGSVRWEEFQSNLRMPFFSAYKAGDIVPLQVERDGQTIAIPWKYPSFSRGEFLDQLNSEWWVAYIFWLAGILTVLLVRPKDDSWLLMSLFNFLTAIWLIAGSGLSSYHIWYSAIVLRVAVWLCLPVYLHLHWVFPRPLRKLPPSLVGSVYAVAIFFAIAQIFEFVPDGLFNLAFLVALGGSLILLLIHLWRQPSVRRDFRLLLVVLIMAIAPAMVWIAVRSVVDIPSYYGGVGLLSLPLLPFAYLYSAFRRRLGNLELRVNRFFTTYLFIILLAAVGLPLIALADYTLGVPNKSVIIGSVAAVIAIVAGSRGYPVFENLIDRYILGIPWTSRRLLEDFSTRITTSISVTDLVTVLQEGVFPSLLIRQFAFLQLDQGSINVISTMGLEKERLPEGQDLPALVAQTGTYRSPDLRPGEQPFPWIRLILPLKLGDRLTGFWLLGRRDPDDLYSQREIPVLISLANLTAIALSNTLQTERLKSMYETNISRYEQERLRLAHDLHDSILNDMAALLISGEAPKLSPKFQQAYDALTQRLRDIVDGLRPPLLVFGLKLALEDFAEELIERNQPAVEILTDIQADGEWRYPELVENNLYRIVQEACENSLRYARANKLMIFGRLYEEQIEIRVEDDGVGLEANINLKLNELLSRKHFGLVGMLERANFIGAELSIHSRPGEGTQIQLMWNPAQS